jgi:undecaprenyl diphosphate synthase
LYVNLGAAVRAPVLARAARTYLEISMSKNGMNGGETLDGSRLHVAVIMDGSGRWAQARGLARSEGHRAGRAAVRRVVGSALAHGVRVLTLFSFSTDNWGRPENEVAELMRTFEDFFTRDAAALAARGVRVTAVGRRDRLPLSLCEAIRKIEAVSPSGGNLHVRLAIDYSGRDAILCAARQFQHASDNSAEAFSRVVSELEPGGEAAPDVDLLIRTGGEQRLSNCPLWEIAYAELYFIPCLWPDFGPEEFDTAMREFSMRQRRFGKIPAPVAETVVE